MALLAAACGSEPSTRAIDPLPTLAPETAVQPDDVPGNTSLWETPLNDGDVQESATPLPDGTREISASSLQQHGQTLDQWTQNRAASGSDVEARPPSEGFSSIAWADLIPEGQSSQDLYERFEERLLEVEFGSEEATELYQEMEAAFDTEAVNEDLDGQQIWLAGFVAPLSFDNERVNEFLLVPNFGACIHVPPPPPNQTILVNLDVDTEGLTIDEAWGAVWVEGTLTLVSAETELAPASYTITGATSGVYTRS